MLTRHLTTFAFLCSLVLAARAEPQEGNADLGVPGVPLTNHAVDPYLPSAFEGTDANPLTERSVGILEGLLQPRQNCAAGYGRCRTTGSCCPIGGDCCSDRNCCRAGAWCYGSGASSNHFSGGKDLKGALRVLPDDA